MALVREVDCHLRETESLLQRCIPAVEEAKKRVDGLDWMRRACEALGSADSLQILTEHVGPMRDRLQRLEGALRETLQRLAGSDAPRGSTTLPPPRSEMVAPAREPGTPSPSPASVDATGEPADPAVHNGTHADGPTGRIAPLQRNVTKPFVAPAAVAPPDPEDLERIHELEEENDRQIAKLPFVSDEERHALLTLCAAKARRLRTRLRDSYAVDRRLGDLIRKIVDLKRRYRLGWIDGCERSFDVPDWDAYVERCEEHFRELKIREQARQEEARLARERATQWSIEVDRRGRELRSYLGTEEGRSGSEPEKLRAVLMSYLSVDGSLDPDLLEQLKIHKNLFTGIAFRRVRKDLERLAGGAQADGERAGEIAAIRERVLGRTRGMRTVVFGPFVGDDVRRRAEAALAFERLSWIEANALDESAWEELGRQVRAGEIQMIVRAQNYLSQAANAALSELASKGPAIVIDMDRPEDPEHLLLSIDRSLFPEAAQP
jgi:hypothetical protein